MNKNYIIAIILLSFVCLNFTSSALAIKNQSEGIQSLKHIELISNQQDQELNSVLDKYLKLSNNHDFNGLKNLYASTFMSGDGLNKDEVLALVKETWDNCPDIKYTSEIKNIRINANYATVESLDKACAQTVKKSDLTADIGTIESISYTITYFKKFGKSWKIVSDKVNYESTAIKYGSAKQLNFKLAAPEQVNAGESYTATLQTSLNSGQFAFASISREPIVYPQTEAKEVFRQIDPDQQILERVMKANTTNNNELAAASVGITQVAGNDSNPLIKLTGLAVLFQRINVIPSSTFIQPPKETENASNDDKLLLEDSEQQ